MYYKMCTQIIDALGSAFSFEDENSVLGQVLSTWFERLKLNVKLDKTNPSTAIKGSS